MVTKSFREKAAGVKFEEPTSVPVPSPTGAGATGPHPPRTAIGQHAAAMFNNQQQAVENAVLRERLEALEGAGSGRPALLDPKSIRRSKWANRHDDSFTDTGFIELKESIREEGGNIVPILVRPIAGEPGQYELAYGSRRCQACDDLGIQVLAFVEELDDKALFLKMDKENRHRQDLRPFEQGRSYANALDAGLYSSARQLAMELGLDPGGVGRLISIGRLPDTLVNAFPSPLEIQYDWGVILTKALQHNPDAVLAASEEIASESPRPSAKATLARLAEAGSSEGKGPTAVVPVVIQGAGRKAKLTYSRNGGAKIAIDQVAPERRAILEELIKQFLG